MVLTASNMLPLGTSAPDFTLLDAVSGKMLGLQQLKSEVATVIMFICNHCPYVQHIQHELAKLARDYQPKKVSFVAINSNDIKNYPDDAPDKMKTTAEELGYTFPYLFDASQEIAKAYRAACTPDFYIFDHNLHCQYRGQFDDSRPGNSVPVTGRDVRAALDCMLAGTPVENNQKPSMGCNIKWSDSN